MRRRHQRKMYPPRVKMTVSLKNPDITLKLPIKFAGCSSDNQLDVEITFPLGDLAIHSYNWPFMVDIHLPLYLNSFTAGFSSLGPSLSNSQASSQSGGSQMIICELILYGLWL